MNRTFALLFGLSLALCMAAFCWSINYLGEVDGQGKSALSATVAVLSAILASVVWYFKKPRKVH